MYIRCCALACLVTLMSGGMTAQAADLYRAPPPPPVSYVPPVVPANTWTGFYAGINGGYGWGGGSNTISYFDGKISRRAHSRRVVSAAARSATTTRLAPSSLALNPTSKAQGSPTA